eukprot:TRINITY_DN89515_c0_g1_i1.p1 TRINITY_DN89515_c0_g1~~TRINITY_DN89515_c0_g1_i1.p1  ORF type:complete len:437 (-),score=72.66 TRINITY_DN89515_c0_g1_i1:300-1610(-)
MMKTTKLILSLVLSCIPGCESSAATSRVMNFMEKHKQAHALSLSQKEKLYMPEKSALDEMEASLVSMAKERITQGSAAANLTDFLSQIQQIIDQTMVTSILSRYNASQTLLDTTWANYTAGGCQAPGNAPWSQYTPYNDQHVTCRAEIQAVYTSYQSCRDDQAVIDTAAQARCAAYNQLNTMSKYSPSPCVMPPLTATPTIGNYLRHMLQYWQTEKANLIAAREGCQNVTTTSGPNVDCNSLYCTWLQKRYECDQYQQRFENGACSLSREYTCSIYTGCMTAKKNAYDAAHASANASQPGLQAEWRAVKRIECLISALGYPASQLQAQIDACIALTHSTTQVTFTFYGPTTPVPVCDQTLYANMTPGNAAFSTRWYSGISSSVSAVEDGRQVGSPKTCASSTCDCWNGTAPVCDLVVAGSAGIGSGSATHGIEDLA